MSMAEYMYKLMYGRKMGRSCYKIRQNSYIGGGSYCYSNDAAECNISCSYSQNPYPPNEAAYHEIYPLWMGGILDSDAGCISAAAPDDAKGHRASPTVCPTPWINYWSDPATEDPGGYAGGQERPTLGSTVDMDGFYKLPPGAEEGHPGGEARGSSSSPNRGVPKHCRFNSPSSSSASVESADETTKFSHTLQFQMAQHIWDGGPLLGAPSMESVDALQCQEDGPVANIIGGSSYTMEALDGGAEGVYSSPSSSSSSVRAASHSEGLLYPYSSSCRSANNPYAGEFFQPEFPYKVPIADCGGVTPNKTEEDQCIMAAYQRWGPHHMGPHHAGGSHEGGDAVFSCDGGPPMGMYPCPFGGCPKIGVSPGGLDPLEFQTGYAMTMTAPGRQDVKHETKNIVRRSRYQLISFEPRPPFIGGSSSSAAAASSIPGSSAPSSSSSSSSLSAAAASASFAQQQQQQLKTSAPSSSSCLATHTSRNLLLRPEVKLMREPSQMCAVCGDNAACQHYGVRTCEGCKGFFKRTVQKGSKYVCLSGNNCPIDKRRRNRCQFCRFKKCLTVGMVKEVVRTDSLKGRRGRLPSKVKHLGQGQGVSPMMTTTTMTTTTTTHANPDNNYQLNLISGLLRAHVDTSPDFLNLDYSLFRSPAEDDDDACSTSRESVEQLYKLLIDIADLVQRWADRVPGFRQLVKEDKETLLRGSLLELILLRTSLGIEPNEDRVTFSTGLVLHRRQCAQAFGPWIERIVDFGRSLKSLEADLPTIACLSTLVLLQANKKLLKEPETVSSLHANFKNALKAHCQGQGKHHLLPVLAEKLAELKHLCHEGVVRLMTLRSIVEIPSASPLELMLSSGAEASSS